MKSTTFLLLIFFFINNSRINSQGFECGFEGSTEQTLASSFQTVLLLE